MAREIRGQGGFRYRAFISYSRKDRDVAKRLQASLEGYVLPAALRALSAGARMDARPIKPVFRDEDELIPGQDLPSRIRKGLQDSEFLIVLCSPAAAASSWVEQEICDFVRMGGRQNILIVVAGGEPYAGDANLEALPKALRYVVADDGTITDTPAEPLWIDWRDGALRSDRAMFLRMVAALLSLESLDDLIRRDARVQRRTSIVRWTAVAAILVGTAVAGTLLIRGERQKLADRSQVLTRLAEGARDNARYESALRLAIAADHGSDDLLLGFDKSPKADSVISESLFNDPAQASPVLADGEFVQSASFSPDGRLALTASGNAARLWDAGSGKQHGPDMTQDGENISASFSPDGKLVATCSEGGPVQMWRVDDGSRVFQIPKSENAKPICVFSPDGHLLATEANSLVVLRRVTDGAEAAPAIMFEDDDAKVVFSPDGSLLATQSENDAILWNPLTGQKAFPALADSDNTDDNVTSFAFSPDGKLAAVTTGTEVRIFDTATGKADNHPIELEEDVGAAWFTPDGNSIVTLSGDLDQGLNHLVTWSVLSHDQRDEQTLDTAIYALGFSPDGRLLVVGSADGGVRIWPLAPDNRSRSPFRETLPVVALAVSSDGRHVLIGTEGGARLWRFADGAPTDALLQHEKTVSSARYSPDGASVVTASADHTARIWRASTGGAIGGPLMHAGPVTDAIFSPDGRWIATAFGDDVQIWNAASAQKIGKPIVNPGNVISAAFSKDGRLLLVVSKKGVVLWRLTADGAASSMTQFGPHSAPVSASLSPDGSLALVVNSERSLDVWRTADGEKLTTSVGLEAGVNSARFSPDGLLVVTTRFDQTVHLTDVASGSDLMTAKDPAGLEDAVISPDGKHVLTWSLDNIVRILDASDGHELHTMKQSGSIAWMSFSPTGEFVATATLGGRTRLWSVATGQQIGPTMFSADAITSAGFSPDGRQLLTTSDESIARVWAIGQMITPVEDPVDVACRRLRTVGTSVLSSSDKAAAPFLTSNAFNVPGDVCQMNAPWRAFLAGVFG